MKSIIILAALILVGSSLSIKLTCGDCNMNCSSNSKCFFASGNNYQEQYCSNQPFCNSDRPLFFDVHKCQIDVDGQTCPTKICVLEQIRECVASNNGCPVTESITTCGKCSQQICPFCRTTNNFQPQCNSKECDWQVKSVVAPCENNVDSQGNQCSCCAETIRIRGNIGICSERYPQLGTTEDLEELLLEAIQIQEEELKKKQAQQEKQNQLRTFEVNNFFKIGILVAFLIMIMI